MISSNQLKNQHLLWRAGFGPAAAELDQLPHISQKSLFKSMLKASSAEPAFFDVADPATKALVMSVGDGMMLKKKDLTEEEKKNLRKQSAEDIKKLNLSWLNEMVNSEAQLREKMALFWHGHFATRDVNIFYEQSILDIIRSMALGSFKDLLREVSKTGAMINFLNNNQNKKDHPNENFAREVMELFTLGRGNYTEQDVKESARAFTGWGADYQGNFIFRKQQHDEGSKTILGQTGNFTGDNVIDILLEQKQTAYFITKKIYRFFVNDLPDENIINSLSAEFYQQDYDIRQLMESIFTSSWFYDPKNIGTHIKSPVELLVGIRRILPMEIENPEVQVLIQRLLGQLLFYPPNVAGWPGGMNWIDSSSLMFRLRIPQIMYDADAIRMKPKDDDDQMMGMKDPSAVNRVRKNAKVKGPQFIQSQIHWNLFLDHFNKVTDDALFASVENVLLQVNGNLDAQELKKYTDSGSRESLLKTTTIRLMSTPEYQLS